MYSFLQPLTVAWVVQEPSRAQRTPLSISMETRLLALPV
jgi:hypothetical protein